MGNFIQNLLVGVLFFGALAIVGYFTVISESGPFSPSGNQIVVLFDDASDIKSGSRVTVLGVPMGTVESVQLVTTDVYGRPVPADSPERFKNRVAVTCEMKRPVVFYDNYSVLIKNESLLSGKIISIEPGQAIDEKGEEHQVITVIQASSDELKQKGLTAFENQMKQSHAGFSELEGKASGDPIAGLSELISENREDVRRTIQNVAEITTKINHGKGTIGLLVNDDELHRNASTLVTDAQIVVRELRESLEDTREQAPVTSVLRAALTAF